ncbi:hypothetical protein EZS27_038159, partial [termite gut metagenome]
MGMIDILQWLIPSGGLGAALIWITNRRLRNTRTEKEVHETYKILYEDISKTLIEIQNENKRLHSAVSSLEYAISKANTCSQYARCPIRRELPECQTDAGT